MEEASGGSSYALWIECCSGEVSKVANRPRTESLFYTIRASMRLSSFLPDVLPNLTVAPPLPPREMTDGRLVASFLLAAAQ